MSDERSKHDFRTMNNPPRVACIYCNVEKWKVEPEEECKMRILQETYDNGKTK